ncbi:synaptogenesis protein syg-2-like [Lytechinus variegatus]|uniref:synaptogenesis protein syg-2-like n=1 Tax=Lytechinus variegatus TaxID=7654 RepID=UPI001BB1002A|nr:synaptogenesis protein syg-2-like [Lytechinus variegatus]
MESISVQVPLVLFLITISQSSPPNIISITDGRGIQQYCFNNLSLTAGKKNDITCETYGARPPAVLIWRIPSDTVIHLHDQFNVIEDGSYISRKAVTITPSRNDHGKILSCIASHPELQYEPQCSVYLNVYVLPRDVLLFLTGVNQSQSTALHVQEDSPTSITCKSIGSFPATKLSYQLASSAGHADKILNHENISSKRSVLDDTLFDTEGFLAIRPNIEHHGKYLQCFAKLEGSRFEVGFAKLIVYGPPKGIKIISPVDIYDGVEINVICKAVNGYPAPHIHWYIGSRNLTEDSSLNISENKAGRYDAESTLTLRPTRFIHWKRLLCQAVQSTPLPARSVNQSFVLNITCKY